MNTTTKKDIFLNALRARLGLPGVDVNLLQAGLRGYIYPSTTTVNEAAEKIIRDFMDDSNLTPPTQQP